MTAKKSRKAGVAILPKCAAEVAKACAKEAGRYALHAIHVQTNGSVSVLKATDGRILVIARYPHLETSEGLTALVEGRDLADAIKFGKPNDDDGAQLTINDGRAFLDMPRGEVRFPLALGSLPNIDDVVPEHGASVGLAPGEDVGAGLDVVPRAMEIAGKCVGSASGGAQVWPGGAKSPWRIDVEGPYGSATVVWMPVAFDNAKDAADGKAA